jgi:apolipoprotein D and lipocalin family protein
MGKFILCLTISLFISGCTGVPEGIKPVGEFEVQRYLGKWFEIARLDHSFERGLSQVSAEYTLREDGGLQVINRGYSTKDSEWKEAEGTAYFVGDRDIGHLKVSFFGPFYSSYVVFGLDTPDYQYAFISGYNNNYLWLLSRTPTVEQAVIDHFIERAKHHGFNTQELIFVNQR